MVNIGNEWDKILDGEFDKEYYQKLRQFLISEYKSRRIYPNMYDIFNALKYTSYSDVKAVILGQDPYHQPGQAHGLCFSVKKGVRIPPSLVNIYKELENDTGIKPPSHGCLTDWAENGVMLLNATLTVRASQRKREAYGFHTLGKQCQSKEKNDNKSRASCAGGSPPKPSRSAQRLLGRQIFYKDQRISQGKRHRGNRLVN